MVDPPTVLLGLEPPGAGELGRPCRPEGAARFAEGAGHRLAQVAVGRDAGYEHIVARRGQGLERLDGALQVAATCLIQDLVRGDQRREPLHVYSARREVSEFRGGAVQFRVVVVGLRQQEPAELVCRAHQGRPEVVSRGRDGSERVSSPFVRRHICRALRSGF